MQPFSSIAELTLIEHIAVLTIDSPPVNALGQPVREALLQAVQWLEQHDAEALVIRCKGKTFFPGADVREFDQPLSEPTLPQVVTALEHSRKPIVAAMHGTALGGGLEVAMACHLRICTANAKLGVPEVKMGVIPGAGGTQRLPRLVGVPQALQMVAQGEPIPAQEALRTGLVDEVTNEDTLLEAALQLARRALAGDIPVQRTRDRTLPAIDAEVFQRYLQQNTKKIAGQQAPRAAVAVMCDAQSLSFDDAVALERRTFLELRSGPQCKALRHVFFAEREIANIPDLNADTPIAAVHRIGIIGAGTMGAGIAINFLLNGFQVTLVEQQGDALQRGLTNIKSAIDRNVKSGRTTADAAQRALSLLEPSLRYDALGEVDFIIEAAFETMEVKRSIFTLLDTVAKPEAILATNTSYLNIDAIAAITSRPQQVLGMHFFSPANVMKLVEVVRAARTSPTALATTLKLARAIGKLPVVCGVCHGFIGNRMLIALRAAAEELALAGADLYAVDRVAEEFGFAMGPFRVRDLAGLDLGWSRDTQSDTLRDKLCAMNRRGQKTAAGFYDYDASHTASPSPLVLQLVCDMAQQRGIQPRSFTDVEILDRLLRPLIAEGRKLLAEGIALRASDIDVVWIHGYGWPRWTGGPMFYGSLFYGDELEAIAT